MLGFLSVIENIVLSIFFVVFAHAPIALLKLKSAVEPRKKIHNAWSLQENNARSAANQSTCTIVAI